MVLWTLSWWVTGFQSRPWVITPSLLSSNKRCYLLNFLQNRKGADEVPFGLLWYCVPEWALLIISLEFFIHPDPVGGPPNGNTFLQYLLWSKFGGSWSAAQSIKILLNSGSYLQNVSNEHSSSSCTISYLLRISGNSSNLTWISWSFRSLASINFNMHVRAGLDTARRYRCVSLTCKDGRWANGCWWYTPNSSRMWRNSSGVAVVTVEA
jgi:hypothetical protein